MRVLRDKQLQVDSYMGNSLFMEEVYSNTNAEVLEKTECTRTSRQLVTLCDVCPVTALIMLLTAPCPVS